MNGGIKNNEWRSWLSNNDNLKILFTTFYFKKTVIEIVANFKF